MRDRRPPSAMPFRQVHRLLVNLSRFSGWLNRVFQELKRVLNTQEEVYHNLHIWTLKKRFSQGKKFKRVMTGQNALVEPKWPLFHVRWKNDEADVIHAQMNRQNIRCHDDGTLRVPPQKNVQKSRRDWTYNDQVCRIELAIDALTDTNH